MVQLLHVGRYLMREPDESQISLSTYRERVLKVGGHFVQHACNIVIHSAAEHMVNGSVIGDASANSHGLRLP